MTLEEAAAAHNEIPADKVNDNCVQDAQWRLRDVITLASKGRTGADEAPAYVIEAVANLRSWF